MNEKTSTVEALPRSVSMLVEDFTAKHLFATDTTLHQNAIAPNGGSLGPAKKPQSTAPHPDLLPQTTMVTDAENQIPGSTNLSPSEVKNPTDQFTPLHLMAPSTTHLQRSYKSMVVGDRLLQEVDLDNLDSMSDFENTCEDISGLTVMEQNHGKYACPAFCLSEQEEDRIQQPWKDGLIVKLLGRSIGYKALETRLNQLWAKNGSLIIIDLDQDYFLVVFTNYSDRFLALNGGPWLIFDHYLTVRKWCPDFQPTIASIRRVAVWVRFSQLPIEYYDAKMLTFIGNRIGKTVKVDKTTLQQVRGKYARVCVEVDLGEPLLAMFELKGRIYKIEYEGLHQLCLSCGRYGHSKDSCPEKTPTPTAGTENDGSNSNMDGNGGEPCMWTVVQKPRRQKRADPKVSSNETNGGKGTQHSTKKDGASGATIGSRFAILHNEPVKHPQTEISTDSQQRMDLTPSNHGNNSHIHGQNTPTNMEKPQSTSPSVVMESTPRRQKKDTGHSQAKPELKILHSLQDKNGVNVKVKIREPTTTMSNFSIDRLKRDIQQVKHEQGTTNIADFINQVVYNKPRNNLFTHKPPGSATSNTSQMVEIHHPSTPMDINSNTTKEPPDKATHHESDLLGTGTKKLEENTSDKKAESFAANQGREDLPKPTQ